MADAADDKPGLDAELPSHAVPLGVLGRERLEVEALRDHIDVIRSDPIFLDHVIAHCMGEDDNVVRSPRHPTIQRDVKRGADHPNLVRVVPCQDHGGAASQRRRNDPHKARVEEVRLKDIDLLVTQQLRQP
jgi:hypothetical protein